MPKTNVKVKLLGQSGNAFYILGAVVKELKKAGYTDIAEEYQNEASKGSYDELLRVTMTYVEID